MSLIMFYRPQFIHFSLVLLWFYFQDGSDFINLESAQYDKTKRLSLSVVFWCRFNK